jgi:predicted SnoaL-like aldol condensation-catalyzing enzyme
MYVTTLPSARSAMMLRRITLLCTLASVFGLLGCGEEAGSTEAASTTVSTSSSSMQQLIDAEVQKATQEATQQATESSSAGASTRLSKVGLTENDIKATEATVMNRAKAVAFFRIAYEQKNTIAIDRLVASDLIQNTPQVQDGAAALKTSLDNYYAANPEAVAKLERVVAQNDLVTLHTSASDTPDGTHRAVMYLLRMENGKIVEQWRVSQQVPENPINDMFSGPRNQPPAVKTQAELESNRQLVVNFYQEVFAGGQLDKLDSYVTESYIQHNPNAESGREALRQFAAAVSGQPVNIVKSAAEGDFVVVYTSSTFQGAPLTTADIFRIENGKLAEHWDVLEQVRWSEGR